MTHQIGIMAFGVSADWCSDRAFEIEESRWSGINDLDRY